jgi:hypothetical protein
MASMAGGVNQISPMFSNTPTIGNSNGMSYTNALFSGGMNNSYGNVDPYSSAGFSATGNGAPMDNFAPLPTGPTGPTG